MAKWPTFKSHRIVQAKPIIAATDDHIVVDGCEHFETTEPAMMARAAVGDYAMIYPDGYRSVCPKAQFEAGYSPFEEAASESAPSPVSREEIEDRIGGLECDLGRDIKEYIAEYRLETDDTSYKPNRFERFLIEDAIRGALFNDYGSLAGLLEAYFAARLAMIMADATEKGRVVLSQAEAMTAGDVGPVADLLRDKDDPNSYRIESSDDDGGCEVAIFSGPGALDRAAEFGAHYYGGFVDEGGLLEETEEV